VKAAAPEREARRRAGSFIQRCAPSFDPAGQPNIRSQQSQSEAAAPKWIEDGPETKARGCVASYGSASQFQIVAVSTGFNHRPRAGTTGPALTTSLH